MSPTRRGVEARVRVVLADDHPMYRDGVARAVKGRPDLELVGEAKDGRTALELIRKAQPDVAVLDMIMPELDGRQVLNAIQRDGMETRVLFLSASVKPEVALEAVKLGAKGYLSKRAERQEICEAILAVNRGEAVLSTEVQGTLVDAISSGETGDGRPHLSSREQEVLVLVADGLSAPEIGKQIHLSPATVKGYLQTLYEKLGVSDRAAAVAEGMRRGLVE